jgi:hypothetical protein
MQEKFENFVILIIHMCFSFPFLIKIKFFFSYKDFFSFFN